MVYKYHIIINRQYQHNMYVLQIWKKILLNKWLVTGQKERENQVRVFGGILHVWLTAK